MKIFDSENTAVYMVGGGGVGLSHPCDSHVYIVTNGGEAVMVDAGSGIKPEMLRERIVADGIDPSTIKEIVLTHSHWDHGRGAAWWKRATGAKLAVHRDGVETLEKVLWPTSHVERRGAKSEPAKVERALEDGDTVSVGKLTFEVIHTPGHSDDSICLYGKIGQTKVLFGGDTCFAEGRHGTVNAETNFRVYRDSVRRIDALRADVLFPGHKHFVLARAFAHISLLEKKLSGSWSDVTNARTPGFPTWWLEHDETLYDDAL